MYLRDTLRPPAKGLGPSAHPLIISLRWWANGGHDVRAQIGCRASLALKDTLILSRKDAKGALPPCTPLFGSQLALGSLCEGAGPHVRFQLANDD